MSTAHQPQPKNGEGKYEKQDVGFRFAMIFVTALILATVVVLLLLAWVYPWFAPEPTRAAVAPRQLPPEPRLQAVPAKDMQRFRENEQRVLTTYGWVDKSSGIVRVPIERAIEVVAEKGLPQWQPLKAQQEMKR